MKGLILILILTVYLSCNYIPCSSSSDLDNVKQLTNQLLIAGIYKPDEFTKQDFEEYSNSDSTYLEVEADGKISLHNFPGKTFGAREDEKLTTVDGSGSWTTSFESGTTILNVNITFKQKGVSPTPPFRLFKKSDKYFILIDFGDPDNCTSVRLRQQ